MSDSSRDIWQDTYSHVMLVSGRLDGFKRFYDTQYPDPDNPVGSQLSVDVSDGDWIWINGVVITGLNGTERAAVDKTEYMYDTITVSTDLFHPYDSVPDDVVSDISAEITVYVRDPDHVQFDQTNPAPQMAGYNDLVMDGFRTLAQLYAENQAEQFADRMQRDFRRTTYAKDNGEWRSLAEYDPFQGRFF